MILCVVVLADAFVSCSRGNHEDFVAKQKYQLRGAVIAVDVGSKSASIKHEKIEGYMDAMTMEFPVLDEGQLAKLKKGAKITATLNVNEQRYWLTDVQTLE